MAEEECTLALSTTGFEDVCDKSKKTALRYGWKDDGFPGR